MKKLVCVILVIFLTGCSSQKANEPKEQENSTNHTTSMKSSTNHYSSSTETSSNKTSESASTTQASAKSKNEVSTNVEETNSLEATPYAVDLSSLNNPLVFNFKGMNVPTSITLENLNSTPTATFRTKLFGAENGQVKEAINKYELSINTIPTKEIRIFSAGDNSIRTVKVNTELILGTNISSNDEQNRSGTLYLFNNKNGSKSLITPNYAGNVTDDQKDVMLEVIQ
ncbi:hypothetical protein [Enterococcus faecalis]|uniref:hypothetical protein n=1 Tax=Enterococcus faecalis TaxID=1351 RepID=UPI0012AB6050|nr:hypothetical protein [Enterococcus faecalis]